jgi:lysophospholipase L1-like esterase
VSRDHQQLKGFKEPDADPRLICDRDADYIGRCMSLTRLLTVALLTGLLANTARGQNLEPAAATKAPPKPQNPALAQIKDVPGLPRVLLIGDSISMGYTLLVRQKLEGRANVHHPPENCGPTERGLARLDQWLGTGHWDVIHFNFGLHDLKYLDEKGRYVPPAQGKQVAPPEVYRRQLRELTLRLKKTGAKLIFATTTPVPPGTLGRVAGDERTYNDEARAVMKELDVPIDDLGGYVAAQQKQLPPRPASELPPPPRHLAPRPGEIQLPFNVHFTPEGYEQLANLVVASIEKELPPPASRPTSR